MVTKYSGRTGSVGGRTKLVVTMSPSSVRNSTSSVTITAKLYWDSKYRTQDSQNTVKMTGSLGSWSGSSSFNGTSKLLHTMKKTVSTSYSGSKKITVNGYISGVEASPGSHAVSASITIPKRPVAKPNTPSNVKMALLSDNRHKTTWSHSTSTARPVSSYTVQYQRLDGGTWTGWMHSATVKGKSYTSNPGTNNKSYRRRVRANNSAGSSGWAYSNYVRMQPYAPTNLKARVSSSGSDIKLTWGFNDPAESTAFKLYLQRRVNGGSWQNVDTSFGQIKSKPYTSSYTDTNPGNGSNQYRIKIVNNAEGGDSVWTTSNTVSTIVPPKAPDHLSPDGGVVDFTESVAFTWDHHDDGDGADQSHFDLRYQQIGGTANKIRGAQPLDPSQWGDLPDGIEVPGASHVTQHGNWTFNTSTGVIRVQPEDSTESVTWNGTVFEVSPGQKFRMSYETRGTWTNACARVWVYWFDEDMNPLTGSPVGVACDAATEQWLLREGTEVAPDNAAYGVARPYLSVNNPTSVWAEFRNIYLFLDEWKFAKHGGIASEKSEWIAEPGTFENGVDYMWQVHTQGNTKEGYGPWSKPAFVTGWTSPVASIREGTPPNPLTALPVPVSWSYSQDEGLSQIAWRARIYSIDSGGAFDAILEEKEAESTSTSTEFGTALADGQRYGVAVQVRNAKGQWSEWDELVFDVELLVPAELRAEVDYNGDTGQMNIHVISDEPVADETTEIVQIDVERRINGGEWLPIMVGIPFDAETTLVDNLPSIWGVNEYRVTATTEAPSKGVFGPWRRTVNNDKGNTEMWTFLNYGETFDYMLRMQGDLSLGGSYDRSKETQKLLGRKKPISLLGEQLSREHSVSGTIHFADPCEVDTIPDDPMQVIGSQFFDDSKAWNFAGVQAGPESRVTADAHYRAKRYGYLMDVVEGNTENLVSPSPRSGVPGTEVPGREVEEVTARNLWRGSKLSVDRSAISVSGNYAAEQVDDGLRITAISDPGTGAFSLTWTPTGGLVTDLPKSGSLSLTVPLRNDGTVPIPVRVAMWTRDSSGATLTTGVDYGHVMMPGEIYLAKVEAQELTERSYDARYSMYYGTNTERPIVGSVFTVLDGITLVQDDVAADPFNGDGAQKQDELVRRNLVKYPVGDRATGRTGWRISGGEVHEFIADDGGHPAIEARDEVGGGQVYIDPNATFTPAKGQWIAFGVDVKALDEERAEKMKLSISPYSGTELANPSSITPVTTDSYTRITSVRQVTAAPDGGYVRTLIWPSNVDAPGGFRFRHAVVAIADSEDEALSAVRTYFDGDSQDNGVYRYVYEGEPGASASAEYRVTDVLRRNRATNGALHDDEKWWSYSLAPTDSVIVERVEGGPVGDHYRRLTLDGVDATSSGGIYYRDSGVSGRGGDVVSVGVWVKQTAGTRFRLSLAARKGGSNVGNAEGGYVDATGDWQWVTNTGMEIKSEYDYVQVWAVAISPTAGFEQSMTGVTIVDGYDAPESFFDSHTPDTYNRLYRKAPDGSSIEMVTDSQSLYRWLGTPGDSQSEKYLPAAPEHFDEYTEMVRVDSDETYEIEAYVRAPELKNLRRRNLTSQGTFASDRQIWGSDSLYSGLAGDWSEDSDFEFGALRLGTKTFSLSPTPTGYVATKATAGIIGLSGLAGRDFTLGIDAYAEGEDANNEQKIIVYAYDSAGERIDSFTEQVNVTADISRHVMRFTFPTNTASFSIRVTSTASNAPVFWSNVTFEEGETDGDWIEDSVQELTGAENIDRAVLKVESFDSDGESFGVEEIAELEPDDFSSRWRTLNGEFTTGAYAQWMRVWVEWEVNGEHPERQSDWYFGGMSLRQLYVVPERWPGPDANPDEWRTAQYESTTVCLRTPSGHRVFGAMSGLDMSAVENNLNSASISFDVTETDYTENPLVIDESDIWDMPVVEAQDDLEIQPGIVIDPY